MKETRVPHQDGDADQGQDFGHVKVNNEAAMALRAKCGRIKKLITHTFDNPMYLWQVPLKHASRGSAKT